MFETYAYLILSLWLLLIWVACFVLRPDLRHRMKKASALGAIAGALAEIWYFKDYWRPPTILGVGVISVEDLITGFAITGIGIALYDVVFRIKNEPAYARHDKWPFILGLFLALVVFTNIFSINSCLVSEAVFVAFAIFILTKRPDLWKASLWSGFFVALAALPAYIILFSWLVPDYWARYWLIPYETWNSIVWQNIPLTEMLWYFTWGAFAGIVQNYTNGTAKTPIAPPRRGRAG